MTQFQLLQSEPRQDVLVLAMSGELDLGTVGPLADAATTAAAGDCKALVFDLTGLEFMDSSGLRVFAQTHRELAAKGREVLVVCASPMLLRVFELTALDQVLTIVATREQALARHLTAA